MAVFFNGNLITVPGVASMVNDSGMANQNIQSPMNLAIIGSAEGGEPGTALTFSDPTTAASVLLGGELLTAVQKAFSPSSQTNGPQQITCLRVDEAQPGKLIIPQAGATLTSGALGAFCVESGERLPLGGLEPGTCALASLKQILLASTSSTVDEAYQGYFVKMTSGVAMGETNLITDYVGATQIATLQFPWLNQPVAGDTYEIAPAAVVLQSVQYGAYAPLTKVQIEAGSESGQTLFGALTSAYGNSGLITEAVNAGLLVSVEYGQENYTQDNISATYMALEYTGSAASCIAAITESGISISAGEIGSEVQLVYVDFSQYKTVGAVVDVLSNTTDLECAGAGQYQNYPTLGAFDYVVGLAISKTTGTAITANLQAVVDWLNNRTGNLVTATRPSGAGVVPATIPFTFLTGGKVEAATYTDWAAALSLLQNEDVQCIVLLSSDSTVHALGQSHVEFMSNQGQSERRCITGGALNETIAEAAARAYAMNCDRMYLVSPGYQDYDANGNLTTYPPYMSAAIMSGMICGLDPGNGLTNLTFTAQGLEQIYQVPSDVVPLLNAGVLPLIKTKKGLKVAQSISTWLIDMNYYRREMGVGYAADYVVRTVRDQVQIFVGRTGGPTSLAQVVTAVETALRNLSKPEPLGPGVLVGDTNSPSYRNIVATENGDVVAVSWECSPGLPMNYILLSCNLVPYSGTITAAGTSS